MRRLLVMAMMLVLATLVGYGFGSTHRYDVNRDGAVNVLDVQLVVNAFLDEP